MTEVQIESDQNRQLVSTTAPGRMLEAVEVQGRTSIADGVIAKLVGIAAREVDGVHDLVGSGPGTAISGLASRVTRADQRAQGVLVEVGEREVAVDLRMVVLYGVNIPQLADMVRRNISDRVSAITGLTVKEVNINVADLFFPEETAPPPSRVQ